VLDRAWVTAAALFVILTISSGLGFYNLSLYMNLLAQQRAFDVAEVSNAVGVYFLVGGFAGLFVGRLLQRLAVRLVIVVGAVLGGGALALVGSVQSVTQLLLVYAVFGVGNTCVSMIPATTLIARWFDAARRPLALSLTSTGLSLGGVILTPLSALLMARWPLETATPLLGATYLMLIAPVAWFYVRSPGETVDPMRADARAGISFGEAVRSRFFACVSIGFVVALGAQVGTIAHLYNRGVELATPLQASFAVSLLAVSSVFGRFAGGFLIGRIALRPFTFINLSGQLLGCTLIALAIDANGLWVGAVIFGMTVGNVLMLQPLLLAQAYGVTEYPRIFSLSQGIATLGIAGGPVLLGVMQSAVGYRIGFLAAAALCGLAAALIGAAGPVPDGDAAHAASLT
jgi:MFS family permease